MSGFRGLPITNRNYRWFSKTQKFHFILMQLILVPRAKGRINSFRTGKALTVPPLNFVW